MIAYFNLTIWVFTIICLSQKLNKCSDNVLYSSSFFGNYIPRCQISHSLLFTRTANNLGIQDEECKENSNRSRRTSESSVSSTDFSSFDSESIECDDSFSSSEGTNSDFPADSIVTRLKSYLALRLPDKFGQSSNSLRRSSSLNPINSNSGHYDTNCDSGDLDDSDSDGSDSDGSDSNSLFPTEGDIVTRLKSYLSLRLPEQFPQPSNSLRRTKSLSSVNADCRKHSTVYISDDSDGADLSGPRACNFHSLSDLCNGSLDATNSNQGTVDDKKATARLFSPKLTLFKSYNHFGSSAGSPFYSKRHKSLRSELLSLKQNVISLKPLFSTKATSYKSLNPNFEPSYVGHKDLRPNVGPYVTNCCSVSSIKLATPTKTTKKRVVKREALIKSRSNSPSMVSPTFSKTMPERHQSAILRSACGSNLQGPSFQSSSVMPNTKSSSKRRAPPPPAHPPYSVRKGAKILQKHRASPSFTSSPCSDKTNTKNPQIRRTPPPPTNPPCSVKTETKSSPKRRAPPPPTHSQSSVKVRTRSSNKRRTPSPPSTRPYSPKRSSSSSFQLTLLPPIQRSSQSSRAIQKSLQAVTSNPRRRSSSSPPSLPSSPWKHSSSSSPSQRPIRQRSSSLPPRTSQQHEHAPTTSTSESFQSSQSKQRPPRPPLPTIQSIHVQRMFNA
ncbi:cysteine rich protein [Cryptosporidium tyzzeri]|nr:cysteine rich protein [Cryptosporidium tyzzeri]